MSTSLHMQDFQTMLVVNESHLLILNFGIACIVCASLLVCTLLPFQASRCFHCDSKILREAQRSGLVIAIMSPCPLRECPAISSLALPFCLQLPPFIGPTGKSVMEDSPSHGTPSHRRDRKMTRQNTIDGASNTELALAQTRIWIEVRPAE